MLIVLLVLLVLLVVSEVRVNRRIAGFRRRTGDGEGRAGKH